MITLTIEHLKTIIIDGVTGSDGEFYPSDWLLEIEGAYLDKDDGKLHATNARARRQNWGHVVFEFINNMAKNVQGEIFRFRQMLGFEQKEKHPHDYRVGTIVPTFRPNKDETDWTIDVENEPYFFTPKEMLMVTKILRASADTLSRKPGLKRARTTGTNGRSNAARLGGDGWIETFASLRGYSEHVNTVSVSEVLDSGDLMGLGAVLLALTKGMPADRAREIFEKMINPTLPKAEEEGVS